MRDCFPQFLRCIFHDAFHLPKSKTRKTKKLKLHQFMPYRGMNSNMILPSKVLIVNVIVRDQTAINIWIMSALQC